MGGHVAGRSKAATFQSQCYLLCNLAGVTQDSRRRFRACGRYSRTKQGCAGLNLMPNKDRSVNFMVGLYASRPGDLVEENAKPAYPCRPGTDIRPYWPEPLKVYKLPS